MAMILGRLVPNRHLYFLEWMIHSLLDMIQTLILQINYICLFDYLFISSQMSAKPYFMGSTGILHLR